jgi:hypothetical protein
MWRVADKQVRRRLGRDEYGGGFLKRHEIGEHISKHLKSKNALDNDNLSHQVLDVHGHSFGGSGGWGRDHNANQFNLNAQTHVHKRPIDSEARYDTRHEKGNDAKAHAHNEAIESLKRSLAHTGAGRISQHDANHHELVHHDVVLHQFQITPAKPGEAIEHVKPHIVRHG